MSRTDDAPIPTGTITAVSGQTRDTNRVSVFVDGIFAFGMPAPDAADLGIRKGVVLDERLLAAALRTDAVYRAKQRSLGLLAHRPRAVAEIRSRLHRAGFEDDVAEDVVTRLVELGYLDDDAFALSYARSRAESRGFGPRRIHAELRRKGVPETAARRALEALEQERDPLRDAMTIGEKYWGRISRETDPRRRRNRLYGYLARRGYGSDVIMHVFEALENRQP